MTFLLSVFSNRRVLCCLYLTLAAFSNSVWAHGADEPQHGGQVVTSGDVTFELVNKPESVELFLLDDGEDMNTEGQSVKIKLKDVTPAKFITLKPNGGNSFIIEDFTLTAGARILVLVTKADGYSKLGANFIIK